MKNIIFVDFDGVCTSTKETPGSWLTHTADEYGPSPNCVKRLIELCKVTSSKIVISSNWRKFDPDGSWTFSDTLVKNPLPELCKQLGSYCIGMLEPIRHKTKTHALIKWLDDNKDIDSYVVFDDDLTEGFQNEKTYDISAHFIKTDPEYGLTDADCSIAKDILTL